MNTVVVSVYKVANFPTGGGHFWVYMQYVQGLIALGCDVYWLEHFRDVADPPKERELRATFRARMKRFGLEERAFLYKVDPEPTGPGVIRFLDGSARRAGAAIRGADLLLNFHYAIHPELLARFDRTALMDIDPGLLQLWMSAGQLDVPPHDRYLTTGETVGTPEAAFPDCGLEWARVGRPVCLDHWPTAIDPKAEAFTTVSGWASASFLEVQVDGETQLVDNTKRAAFLEMAELPTRVEQPLELALCLLDRDPAGRARPHQAEKDAHDRADLERLGWRVRDAWDVAGCPDSYRSYIQGSRGEFSCAKRSCIDLRNAWVSDRTLCYLASGKPVVVQHTGPSAYLPDAEGMFRFRSIDDAAAALEAVDRDYRHHCRAARDIAETWFDAEKVLEAVLNAGLGTHPAVASGMDGRRAPS